MVRYHFTARFPGLSSWGWRIVRLFAGGEMRLEGGVWQTVESGVAPGDLGRAREAAGRFLDDVAGECRMWGLRAELEMELQGDPCPVKVSV